MAAPAHDLAHPPIPGDPLREVVPFNALPEAALADLAAACRIEHFRQGETIFAQAEGCASVYVVLAGLVQLSHRAVSGKEIPIITAREGELFGDVSLLTTGSRFASARAAQATTLCFIPADRFHLLLDQYPRFGKALLQTWGKTFLHGILHDLAGREYQRQLFTQKETLPCLPLIGDSLRAKKLRNLVEPLAAGLAPLLIIGEKGSMKKRLAGFLHETGNRRDSPFLLYDSANPPAFFDAGEDQGVDPHALALFGLAGPHAGWRGLLTMAENGTLVVARADLLDAAVQDRLAASLQESGPHAPRVILTARAADMLIPKLLRCFPEKASVSLPPLRERKKDLKLMADAVIAAIAGESGAPPIGQEAVNRMLAYQWPGNYRELEEVVKRALYLAGRETLEAEDIYIGTVRITGKNAFNLLNVPSIRGFFQNPSYPVVPQSIIAGLFLVIIALGLWGNPAADSNVALLLVWANWEPLLILSCFFAARIWCSFCPVGFLAERVNTLPLRQRPAPALLQNLGFLLSGFGLLVIFWAQAAFDMWRQPANTAALLLAILFFAVAVSALFREKIWCRVLCPLGQMVATFARLSLVELRTNANYCSNECTTYDCSVGRENVPGCRMLKGPFLLESNAGCTLCGNCIKSCRNNAVRLNLRFPGWELWNSQAADKVALFFVPLLWGTQLFRGVEHSGVAERLAAFLGGNSLALGLLLAACVVFAFHVAVAGIAFTGMIDTDAGMGFGTTFALAMLPLVYANEIAIRMVSLLNHAANFFKVLGNQLGRQLPDIAFRLDLQSIRFLQVICLLLGLVASLAVATRLTKQLPEEQTAPAFFRHLPLFAMTLISVLLL
ncbi:MAG: cyclic nucleotide-binding domain-containing protein [Thermodesulfobacteriota bacterium]